MGERLELKKLTAEQGQEVVDELIFFSDNELHEWDNETAHIQEDKLRAWFINCVAQGMYNVGEAVQVASVVRKCDDIVYHRYFS